MPTLPKLDKSIVLVGLMGVGKTTVGRRLAAALGLPFADSDQEIETAAGMSIADIFETHGEADFRRGEKRVIERLVNGPRCVLATGGGAFVDDDSRALIKSKCISIWLRADLDVLMRRVSKRATRPLLQTDDPHEVMQRLMEERAPYYAQADFTIDSRDSPHDETVDEILNLLSINYGSDKTTSPQTEPEDTAARHD